MMTRARDPIAHTDTHGGTSGAYPPPPRSAEKVRGSNWNTVEWLGDFWKYLVIRTPGTEY
jgi:hypothetical protein